MKTLYWNRISDVIVSNENKKTRKQIGIANPLHVIKAKKEGSIRIFKLSNGNNVGVSEQEWEKFMIIHEDEQLIEKLEIENIPMTALRCLNK